MVKPMPASEAGKVAIGDVGDCTSVGDELDSTSAVFGLGSSVCQG